MLALFRCVRNTTVAVIGMSAVISAAFGQPQSQPAAALAEEVEDIHATVVAVDKEQRLVSLRGDDGQEVTLEASEEVRNFDQIDVGDKVSARFYEALAAEVTNAPPGAEPALLASRRAPVGERPSAAVGFVYTAVVVIDSVDLNEHVVRFTDPDGRPNEVAVRRPQMREFIAQLKPGDRVQVTYGSGLAIEIDPEAEK